MPNKSKKSQDNFMRTESEVVIQSPVDPWKRNFNENDLMGNFMRDHNGKLIILKDLRDS